MDRPPSSEPSSRLGLGMIVAAWALALGLLAFALEYHLSGRSSPNRNLQEQVTEDGAREVELSRNDSGHYVAPGRINGEPVTFVIDTGASDVSIPARLGEELGLEPGASLAYRTANGRIQAHATRIERLTLGPLELRDVRASLNPAMDDREVLLGMSALEALELEQRSGRLTLRQPAR
ncbi:MAG: retropepsin-like aspartic protease family protein [Thiohalospira sp.]|uniref:retropepsin-like aspartic protease family protein n=1 Tax=Thiohalospira sp. TaxID=3080549 RepID=UPI00397FF609